MSLFCCVCAASASSAGAPAAIAWREIVTASPGAVWTAVAFHPATGQLAVGGPEGVWVRAEAGAFSHGLGPRGVRDLAFEAASESNRGLWVATDQGLFRRIARVWLGPFAFAAGASRRAVSRVVAAAGRVALATEHGVFVSAPAQSPQERPEQWESQWSALPAPVPRGPVQGLALRRLPAGEGHALECWALIEGDLWRVVLGGVGVAVQGRVERRSLPVAPRGELPVDLALGLPGADVAVLYPNALVVLATRLQPGQEGAWRVWYPVLPPGARALRVGAALGRVWLATDRGLLEAPTLAGPWRRTGSPAGFRPVQALAGGSQQLFAVDPQKLWWGSEPVAHRATGALPSGLSDPPVVEIQRVAVRILDRSLGRPERRLPRVRRRGWWPEVLFRASHDGDDARDFRYDQTFTYGETHHLYDSGRDRSSGYAVSLALTWDLRDTVFDPEEIDVSRESRAVVALRNDVLDEISQLYFDRARVLADLAALNALGAGEASSDRRRLQLRAQELAAGLDAWTDGWFSQHATLGAP